MADINVTEEIIDINVTEQVIVIEAPSGGYPLPASISSVFGRTGTIVATIGDYDTSKVTENTNLYFTNARARSAISLTTSGTSGAATYDSGTGVLNVPQYQGGVTSFNTRTGAISLISADVSGALTYVPYNSSNPAGYITSSALSTYVPYTGATANLDLGTFDLTTDIINLNQLKAIGSGGLNIYSNSGTHIALMGGGGGAGTTLYGGIIGTTASFASSGGSDTFAINHSSGSGIALNITKDGNGEGLYINKTSGSGNAATIIGTLNATTLVKSGGTSSQFLKADGSVDSTSYQGALTLTTTGSSGAATLVGNTLNIPQYSGGGGMAIGGSITSATAGSVLFAGTSGVLAQDNANFFWDDTNDRLGLGTASPNSRLHISGSTTAASAIARGANLTSTLVAAANSDVLVGLDINPTFTNGAFTGVENIPLRIGGTTVTSSGSFGGANARVRTLISNTASGTFTQLAIQGPSNGGGAIGIYNAIGTAVADFGISILSKEAGFVNRMTSGYITLNTNNGTSLGVRLQISTVGNVLINSTTDAGFQLDVNGTARVQGVITGSVNGGSLIMGAAGANQVALTISGYFTSAGAINTSASNQRSFAAAIGGQGVGYSAIFNGNSQVVTTTSNYFFATGAINITAGTSIINGFNFEPTLTSEVNTTINAFTSNMNAASNRWNLFISGTAQNYLAGALSIGVTTANVSAVLQADSTTKGFLPPRMTTSQKTAISSPATGLVVYDTTLNKLAVYTGAAWETVTSL